MHTKTDRGEDIYINNFNTVIRVPSGSAGLNFGSEGDRFTTETLILGVSYEEFCKEWHRLGG